MKVFSEYPVSLFTVTSSQDKAKEAVNKIMNEKERSDI